MNEDHSGPEDKIGSEDHAGPEGSDSPVERLRRRDELLQVLFWLEGEGFEAEMHVEGVRRFLHWPEARVRTGLDELVADGFAVRVGRTATRPSDRPDRGVDRADRGIDRADRGVVRLTEAGRMEGGRRFVAEFATLLSRDTHHGGECHDPECDCQTLGPAACTAFPRERA